MSEPAWTVQFDHRISECPVYTQRRQGWTDSPHYDLLWRVAGYDKTTDHQILPTSTFARVEMLRDLRQAVELERVSGSAMV